MDVFTGLFGPCASAYSQGDARAMTPDEIQKQAIANFPATRQAVRDPGYWMLLRNYVPVDPRPLDERFADFKLRLEAALIKHQRSNLL